MNALINAARAGVSVLSGNLYLAGEDAKSNATIAPVPCEMCKRVIINAGIKRVVIRDASNDVRYIDVEEWINNETQSKIKPQ
jgi:dCMP deaminase